MIKRVLLAALLVVMIPIGASAETVKRWATGVVVATDTAAVPNTIVIKAKNWKGLDMIVGAAIDKDTAITRGGKSIQLGEIRSGDKVSMEYTRNKKVTARKIYVR